MHVLISALHRPSKPTGVCRHAANLAKCLVDINEITKITLLIGEWQCHYFAKVFNLCSDKINIISVDIQNTSVARNIWFLWGLPKLTNQLCPDIVHLSFPMPFLRIRFSCPVIATIHDLYPYECPENFGKIQVIFNQFFLKMCVEQSDGLVCVSQTTLDRFNLFFPYRPDHQELTAIYNIVDFSRVKPKIPELFKEKEYMPFLLSVAQHRKNKNLDILIDAYEYLLKNSQTNPPITLIIVGDHGPETENLTRQIKDLNLQINIHLLASIGDGELCWLYQQCEAFVIPSSIEGFCLPLAEAIHLSCKVICSDIPIFREIGSLDCMYFDLEGDSTRNLSKAILQVIQEPPPLSCRTSRFSKIGIANQYIEFYSRVLNKQK